MFFLLCSDVNLKIIALTNKLETLLDMLSYTLNPEQQTLICVNQIPNVSCGQWLQKREGRAEKGENKYSCD